MTRKGMAMESISERQWSMERKWRGKEKASEKRMIQAADAPSTLPWVVIESNYIYSITL
jgi:predicted dithiol-disulfide oxidoreductase (DUF899 family)